MRIQRIERLQRIIAIQGVSLVRILNHPSLDRLVGRDSKYPLTQSVGRENLSGCHLAPRGLRPLGARWHPSRFSLPLSFVCGYSRISPFLTLSFGEDLWILTRSPPGITLIQPRGNNDFCATVRFSNFQCVLRHSDIKSDSRRQLFGTVVNDTDWHTDYREK